MGPLGHTAHIETPNREEVMAASAMTLVWLREPSAAVDGR